MIRMIRGLSHNVDSYLTQNSPNSQKDFLQADILCVPWFLCDLNPLRIETD